jgi:hypothetical protein
LTATTGSNTSSNSNTTLTADRIDDLVSQLDNASVVANSNASFIMVQPPKQDGDKIIILGASFKRNSGGQLVNISNKDDIIKSNLSTAVIISNESLINVRSINILIINDPTAFRTIDSSSNKILESSVIVMKLQQINESSELRINMALYFQLFNGSERKDHGKYACSFYNRNTSAWDEYGCVTSEYKEVFDRFECTCNHTTSFALIWSPNTPSTKDLTAQDIASLAFQSLSILCFLAIIIHELTVRIRNPMESIQARHLLPLISSGITMILFIFFIALGLTVRTKTSFDNETQCFLSSKVLMFFVYFFLILMFCVKTSIGYFNYLRFVHLFPEPSYRKLYIMLLISFFISITWVAFAAGFNSNPSFNITELRPYQLCWFTRNATYYFLLIPTGIFILINLITFILVATRIINHVQHATSPHQSYERMKRCVVVLLSSCFTQGLGWIFGPIILFTSEDPTASDVLGWFFIIFNGLEGLWAIIVYIIIRSQHMDERRRVTAYREITRSTSLSFRGRETSVKNNLTERFSSINSYARKQLPVFNDLYSIKDNYGESSKC